MLEDRNIHVYSYQLRQSVWNIKQICLIKLKTINIMYNIERHVFMIIDSILWQGLWGRYSGSWIYNYLYNHRLSSLYSIVLLLSPTIILTVINLQNMVDSVILLKMLEFFIDIYFKSYRRDFHQTVVGGLMAFNRRSFLSVEETRVHGGNHQLCIRVCIMYGSSMYAVSITL